MYLWIFLFRCEQHLDKFGLGDAMMYTWLVAKKEFFFQIYVYVLQFRKFLLVQD